jgi:hypothetical protein
MKRHLILTISNDSPRYLGNFSPNPILANRETDMQHGLRTYLQDYQAHEELALKLQKVTAVEATRGDNVGVKAKQVRGP